MTSQEPSPATKDVIEAALDEFCEAWFSGERLDPDVFCQSHPKCGSELRDRIESFLVVAEAQASGPRPGETNSSEASDKAGIVPGLELGDFRVIREIGCGGMGSVYEAEQISLKRRVALKVLRPHLSISHKAVLKFRREAEAGSRQTHSGIVSVYAVGEHEGTHFLAQELVEEGRTLADMLHEYRDADTLPRGYFREVAELIAGVADALQHAHASGVIHRDVKPSNILLSKQGLPKVSDFGLARLEDALALSRSGEFSGTPFYMSPEQAVSRRHNIDHRTDIFSLGVTLYESLVLKRPFDGETSHEVIRKVLLQEPHDPRKLNARVPRDLSVICLKTLEKDPRHRYQTMAEFGDDLTRFLEGESIFARPAGTIRKSMKWMNRHKVMVVAAGVALLAAVAVTILLLVVSIQHRRQREFAERGFKPIQEAFEWTELDDPKNSEDVWDWCLRVSPSHPGWYIVRATFEIHLGALEDAERHLEESIKKCKGHNEGDLERDAHYLMAVVKLRQTQRCGDNHELTQSLIKQASSELEIAGEFDFDSQEAVVWRFKDHRSGGDDDQDWYLKPIKLNIDHYLIQLYLGMWTSNPLYLGGKKTDFDKAVEHFERVLKARPNNVAALTFLGRLYFFLARSYNFLSVTDEARDHLTRALKLLSDQPDHTVETPMGRFGVPYHMIDTSLGQLSFLRGDEKASRRHFERACELRKDCSHIHNAWRGLGKVYARQGEPDKALEMFHKSLEPYPFDRHSHVALAEFHLSRHETEKALSHGKQARSGYWKSPIVQRESESQYAPAYLVCARIHLERGEYEEAIECLDALCIIARISPHTLSLACFLIAVFPRDAISDADEAQSLTALAKSMTNRALRYARHEGRISPICLSAQGSVHYLMGHYRDAIDSFEKARQERSEKWPEEINRAHWPEDARDLYFLAMAHFGLSQAGEQNSVEVWRECYERAEALWKENQPPFEYRDIHKRIRNRAREALGIPP